MTSNRMSAKALMEDAWVLYQKAQNTVLKNFTANPHEVFRSTNVVLLSVLEGFLDEIEISWHTNPRKKGWDNHHAVLVITFEDEQRISVPLPLGAITNEELKSKVRKKMNKQMTLEEAGKIADVRERNIAYGQILINEGKNKFEAMEASEKQSCLTNMAKMRDFEKRAVAFAQAVGLEITLVSHEVGASGQGFYFGYNVYSRFQKSTIDYVEFVLRMVGILSPNAAAVEKATQWIWTGR